MSSTSAIYCLPILHTTLSNNLTVAQTDSMNKVTGFINVTKRNYKLWSNIESVLKLKFWSRKAEE